MNHKLRYALLLATMYFLPLNSSAQKQMVSSQSSFNSAVSTASAGTQEPWSPEHVYYGYGGGLTYTPDEQGNVIPDFSHVGYKMGDEAIPDIPVKVTVSPVDGDDGATIQAAIDQVAAMTADANGFRGAVLLTAGTYQVSGQIVIDASGVVLRGEGDTDAGTVIIAEGTSQRELIKVDNGASRITNSAAQVSIVESYVPVGRKFVVVSDASGYAAGDEIIVYRPGTAQWITDIKMDQLTPSDGTVQWSAGSYSFEFERILTRVSGDTLFFRNPLVMAMETQYGGGIVYKYSFDRLEKVGVENLCLKSAYASATDEDHSWNAVKLLSVEHGWVRNVTSWYFAYACVNLERNSKFITVENCHSREPKSIITGARRYSFNLAGSMNLFKDCTTTEGRHDYVTSSRVCGPNVFTRCTASNTHADIGPHHRWAMGTLYDVIETDGEINVQDRDDMGSGHGWAGANQVFWNCKGSASICQSPWASAKNYNFGFIGAKKDGARSGRPDGEWVGHNVPGIFPESLYEAQLADRGGESLYFSAITELETVTDSTFLMTFTKPLDQATVIKSNFTVSGTAGAQEKDYTVSLQDESSVLIAFKDLGLLPAYSTIMVTANGVKSTDGDMLEGVTTSHYTEPDRRPAVTGIGVTVDNVSGFVVASSTKAGQVHLVLFGEYPDSMEELIALEDLNKCSSADAPDPGISVPIYTKGLEPGTYHYYASDEDGRVSLPRNTWVKVEDGGGTDASDVFEKTTFKAYRSFEELVVLPANSKDVYGVEVYSLAGQLIYKNDFMIGEQRLAIGVAEAMLIVRLYHPLDDRDESLIIF